MKIITSKDLEEIRLTPGDFLRVIYTNHEGKNELLNTQITRSYSFDKIIISEQESLEDMTDVISISMGTKNI